MRLSIFRLVLFLFFFGSLSPVHADVVIPDVKPLLSDSHIAHDHLTLVNSAKEIVNSSKTVNMYCRPKSSPNIYKKLAKPDIKKLEKSFGMTAVEIEKMLQRRPNSSLPYLPDMSVIRDGFDSPEVTELFFNFLNNKNLQDLSILLTTSEKQSFDKKGKQRVADAKFAYGIIHLFYRNKGGNEKLGNKYIKEAAKKNQYGARYIEGMRWYLGLDRQRNLTNAATWMRPSYEQAYKRKGDFSNLVQDSFFDIVFHPNYPQRDLYINLMQEAQRIKAEMTQQVSSQGFSAGTVLRNDVIALSIQRSNLLIELGNFLEMGEEVDRYSLAIKDILQTNNDTILDELLTVSNSFQEGVEKRLSELKKMDQKSLKQLVSIHNRNANYASELITFKLKYSAILIFKFKLDQDNSVVDYDNLRMLEETGLIKEGVCRIHNGLLSYIKQTNFDVKLSNPVVVDGIAMPKKK